MTATPFLDLEQLRRITADVAIRTRGHWRLTVEQDKYLGPCLRIIGEVPDNTNPDETIDLGITSRIPPCRDQNMYLDWLLHRWIEIAIHEAREQLTYQGKPWDHPHTEATP